MKLFLTICLCVILMVSSGCDKKEPPLEEQVLGVWTQSNEVTYMQISINPKGMWDSNVKIANPRSKIVAFKGSASGTWYVQEKQLIMTVVDSTIEKVWGKNSIYNFEIQEVLASRIIVQNSDEEVFNWEKEDAGQVPDANLASLSMPPIAVNLDKISSNTRDSYLCVKIDILLKELMPGNPPPSMHPKIRDAAVLFLSSLINEQVNNFDEVDIQRNALTKILNPYLDGAIKQIDFKKILIASSYEKVEEFLMEFTPPPAVENGEENQEE